MKRNNVIVRLAGLATFFLLGSLIGFTIGRLTHHHWVEVARHHYLPKTDAEATWITIDEVNRLAFGGCIVEFKDTTTGDIKTEDIIGMPCN